MERGRLNGGVLSPALDRDRVDGDVGDLTRVGDIAPGGEPGTGEASYMSAWFTSSPSGGGDFRLRVRSGGGGGRGRCVSILYDGRDIGKQRVQQPAKA